MWAALTATTMIDCRAQVTARIGGSLACNDQQDMTNQMTSPRHGEQVKTEGHSVGCSPRVCSSAAMRFQGARAARRSSLLMPNHPSPGLMVRMHHMLPVLSAAPATNVPLLPDAPRLQQSPQVFGVLPSIGRIGAVPSHLCRQLACDPNRSDSLNGCLADSGEVDARCSYSAKHNSS